MQRLSILILILVAVLVGSAAAQTIGMVCDRGGEQVIVFDANADAVTGAVKIPPASSNSVVCSCAITPDRKLAFVSNFEKRVWVIDLTADPPALATGKNPIPVSTWAGQLAITPDGKHLLVADGFSTPAVPLCAVDIATRSEVDTFLFGVDISPCAVALCPDGSALVASVKWGTGDTTIRRLRVDEFGDLIDTGESIPSTQAPKIGNLICAATGGKTMGIFLSRGWDPLVGGFRVHGMTLQSTATPSGLYAVDGVYDRHGHRLFVRTNALPNHGPTGPGVAFIDVFKLHIGKARIGKLQFTIPLDRKVGTLFGAHQMAIHPNGKKLYVSGLGLPELRVFNPKNGNLIKSIKLPALGNPTAVNVVGP